MYTKDKVPGLITHTSNMVAPQDESTTGDGWKIVRSRKTLRKFNRDFPKYTSPEANPPDEKSISSETSKASSASGNSTTRRYSWADIVKNIDKAPLPKSTIILEEQINKEIDEDSEDYSIMSEKEHSLSSSEPSDEYFSITSDTNSPTTINVDDEHSLSNESEISDDFHCTEDHDKQLKRNLELQVHPKDTIFQVQKPETKRTHETAFSVNCNDGQVHHNLKNNKIMKTSTLSQTARETTSTKEQEKLHQHKEEQACLKETMRKMGDLFEEVRMDVETEDQCIQDIGHTFMTPHGISDKDFSQEIKKDLPRLAATQFPVSRNILVHEKYKINMESKNDWKPFSHQRKAEMQ